MNYTFVDYAHEVLSSADKPLTYREIWDLGSEKGLGKELNTTGITPWSTLGARLYVEIADNPNSKFIKVGTRPARFFLKSKANQLPEHIEKGIKPPERKEKEPKTKYSESDLHPLVSYFASTHPEFSQGRSIFTKTIHHEKSKKPGYSEWSHPDLVGFYWPLDDWDPILIEFNRVTDNNALKLFSFELKKSLTKGNYREAFFQAVSNSSWANAGYLIAAEIKQDNNLLSELERLSMSFGIGVIQLNLGDINSSSMLYRAKEKTQLDWETMNKLSDQNDDFKKFLKNVRIDFDSKLIHKSEYDKVLKDPESYIKKILGNAT